MKWFWTPVVCLALLGCEAKSGAKASAADTGGVAATVAAAPAAGAAAAPRPKENLLTLAAGAVVVSASANAPAALSLTDGAPTTSWHNVGKKDGLPNSFVFELAAPTAVEAVGIVGSGARPGGVQGGAARGVLVEGSAEGPGKGFTALANFEAKADGETMAPVKAGPPVRWVRFTVASNHGSEIWTYVADAVVHGKQAPAAKPLDLTGVFQTGRTDFVELKQDGLSVSGCYTEQAGHTRGTISGAVDGRVALLTWRSDKGVTGRALFTIDSTGALNGVRFRDKSRAAWSGGPAKAGASAACEGPASANPVTAALESDGRAVLYGILFDFDKATLKPESTPALEQLLGALKTDAGLSLTIEGHTDFDGDDAYNQSLSARRAQAVVGWLTGRGIAAGRLTAVGKGESQPAASNDTADGRALNRRVEAVRR